MYQFNPLLEFRIPDIYVGHAISGLTGAVIGSSVGNDITIQRSRKMLDKYLLDDDNVRKLIPRLISAIKNHNSFYVDELKNIDKALASNRSYFGNWGYESMSRKELVEYRKEVVRYIKEYQQDLHTIQQGDVPAIRNIMKNHWLNPKYSTSNMPMNDKLSNKIIRGVSTLGGGAIGFAGYHAIKHPIESGRIIKRLFKK